MKTIYSILDPLYNTIKIEYDFIKKIIDSKEFTRLGRIQQLGFCSLIFPTATHTRKSHSLGVYELARKFLESQVDLKLPELIKKAILCSTLLHDIGHGPFSHSFEEVTSNSHEEYSKEIILSETTEIGKLLRAENKQLPLEVAKIIEGKHELGWVNNLLSSQIDLDRIDYILRDSFFTGKNFGNININFLFENIKIVDDELLFYEDCTLDLEHLLVGRQHLYQSIYWNPKTLCYDYLFKLFFDRIKFLLNSNFSFKSLDIDVFKKILLAKKMEIDDFLKLDDSFFWNEIKKVYFEDDDFLKKIATYFLATSITPKLKLIETNVSKDSKNNHFTEELSIGSFSKFYTEPRKKQAKILTEEKKVLKLQEWSLVINSLFEAYKKIESLTYKLEIDEG